MGIIESYLNGPYRGTREGKSQEQYFLSDTVERGQFSSVICGIRKQDGKAFALKIQNKPLKGYINKELEFLLKFSHENIIRLEDHFHEDARLHLVLQHSGESLIKIKLRPDQIVQVIQSLCDALIYLKSQSMMHLNIKAEHIMMNGNGSIKLIGFGWCKRFPYISLPVYKPRGTTNWMAPELIRGAKNGLGYGFACDIWSLGITVLELLEGHPPHHDEDKTAFIQYVCSPFYKAPTLNPNTPYAYLFANFLALALNVSPKDRAMAERLKVEKIYVNMAMTSEITPTAPVLSFN